MYQLFERIKILDAPLLSTMTMDEIAALKFEPIRARTNATTVTVTETISCLFLDSSWTRDGKYEEEISFALPLTSVTESRQQQQMCKTSSEDNKTEDARLQQ